MFSYKKFVGFLVFIISILSVNLINIWLTEYLFTFKHYDRPGKITLIGMLLLALVLYPAFRWIDDWSEKITLSYFNAGSKSVGGKTVGVIIAFSVVFGILFVCYLHTWFGLFPWDLLTLD